MLNARVPNSHFTYKVAADDLLNCLTYLPNANILCGVTLIILVSNGHSKAQS